MPIKQNKDTPNYESRFFETYKKRLEFIDDMYKGRSQWYNPLQGITDYEKAQIYLTRSPGEPYDQYRERIGRSYFHNIFSDSVLNTVGFLDFTLNEDILDSILKYADNIDGKGNSIEVFFRNADILALLRGWVAILVDFQEKRPYLVLIDRLDIPNGKEKNNLLTNIPVSQITHKLSVSIDEGKFGEKFVDQYQVIGEGWYQLWEEDENGDVSLQKESEYSLSYLPLIIYTLTSLNNSIFTTSPPLEDLAEMQLQLYQKESNKDDILYKLSPFLVLNPMTPGALTDQEIAIGPNTLITNANAEYVAPGADAIGPIQQDIDKLIETMKLKTLSFQIGNTRNTTATEINRDTASSEANLLNMARLKESAIQSIFEIWARWENKPGQGGTVNVNGQLLAKPIDSATVDLYKTLNDRGMLGSDQLLGLLKEGKLLPRDFKISESPNIDALSVAFLPWYELLLKYNVINPGILSLAISQGLTIQEALELELANRMKEDNDYSSLFEDEEGEERDKLKDIGENKKEEDIISSSNNLLKNPLKNPLNKSLNKSLKKTKKKKVLDTIDPLNPKKSKPYDTDLISDSLRGIGD